VFIKRGITNKASPRITDAKVNSVKQ